MIDGVKITPLLQIHDERGSVMHMLKSTDSAFEQFGEIYFSGVYPDVVKAWHIHSKMTLNYAVPVGKIKFVLYDDRKTARPVVRFKRFLWERTTIASLLFHQMSGMDLKVLELKCHSLQIVQASPMIRMKLVASTHRIITSPMTGL